MSRPRDPAEIRRRAGLAFKAQDPAIDDLLGLAAHQQRTGRRPPVILPSARTHPEPEPLVDGASASPPERGSLVRSDHHALGDVDRPIAALDMHLDMIRWLGTATGEDAREAWWAAYTRSIGGRGSYGVDTEWRYNAERHFLDEAMTLLLQPAMAELAAEIAGAAPHPEGGLLHLPPPEPLRITDPWCPHGLVFLPPRHELRYFAVRRMDYGVGDAVVEPMVVRALGWQTTPEIGPVGTAGRRTTPTGGVQLWAYTEPDTLYAEAVQQAELAGETDYMPPRAFRERVGPLALIDCTAWAYDTAWRTADSDMNELDDGPHVDDTGTVHVSSWVAGIRTWLKVLWRLLDEQIVEPHAWRPPRAAARRMSRLAPRRLDGDVVRIIRLRRIYDDRDGTELLGDTLARRFTHAWRVREHWRHYARGDGYVDHDGRSILLDPAHRWELSAHGRPIRLLLTAADGRQERVELDGVPDGNAIGRLRWASSLAGELCEVTRLSLIDAHTAGMGLLIERHDIVSVQR